MKYISSKYSYSITSTNTITYVCIYMHIYLNQMCVYLSLSLSLSLLQKLNDFLRVWNLVNGHAWFFLLFNDVSVWEGKPKLKKEKFQ